MRDGFQLPFSADYAFFACRPVTINGVMYRHGDPVPTTCVAERRLRQLYAQRVISPHVPAFLMNGATPAPSPASVDEPVADAAESTVTDEADTGETVAEQAIADDADAAQETATGEASPVESIASARRRSRKSA